MTLYPYRNADQRDIRIISSRLIYIVILTTISCSARVGPRLCYDLAENLRRHLHDSSEICPRAVLIVTNLNFTI
ncbi:hypothetical protein BJX96DRAFT_7747 [Aspergillus floccosus]